MPPFRRSFIRYPSTIERQIVSSSSDIAHPEPLPSSLYLIYDRRTALDSAEHRSGRFLTRPLRRSPRHLQRANTSTIQANPPVFSPYMRVKSSPVLPQAYKPEKSSSGHRRKPFWPVWRIPLRRRPHHHQREYPSTIERQIDRFSSRIARLEALPSFLKPARERRAGNLKVSIADSTFGV